MASARIVGIEWGTLEGQRSRRAGCNARLGVHGDIIRLPIVRLTDTDGVTGFGPSWAGPDQARSLLGAPLDSLFTLDGTRTDTGIVGVGTHVEWLAFDYPLWDLTGQRASQPVYALAATALNQAVPAALRAPCYDTSLYFDDLHLHSTEDAASYMAGEALAGYARGHRAFKIKIGRGARHLGLMEGTARDIAIVRAVRAAVGACVPLLLDANNGYNLNLAKHALEETADCQVYWLEEAFHEDPVLYQDLKLWLAQREMPVLIADGEGEASAHLLEWARKGLVDVIQYDILGHGFTGWLRTGQQLDAWGIRSAPHHYGSHYGNYAACHLAALLRRFTFVEWDEASTPGLDASGYSVADGHVVVPAIPGFGLKLDEPIFRHAVEAGGGSLKT